MKSKSTVTQIVDRGLKVAKFSLLFICNTATALSNMQDQMYKMDMGFGRTAYVQEYVHIKWSLKIKNILQEITTERHQNVKASMVDCAFGLLK